MSAGTHSAGVRPGTAPDPHIVELGKLMLARAPKLGKAMAELLCREIDAYRDGSVVAKEQVRESCVANVTFIFDSLAGRTTPTSTSRPPSRPAPPARSPVCRCRR